MGNMLINDATTNEGNSNTIAPMPLVTDITPTQSTTDTATQGQYNEANRLAQIAVMLG
jgi:hypothetical protein